MNLMNIGKPERKAQLKEWKDRRLKIVEGRVEGMSYQELARKYGVSTTRIYKIIKYESRKHAETEESKS